jgi:hypothetical protein
VRARANTSYNLIGGNARNIQIGTVATRAGSNAICNFDLPMTPRERVCFFVSALRLHGERFDAAIYQCRIN